MQTAKSNERRGLSAVVGLVVAGATLMAGLVALPVSKAAAYDETQDEFRAQLDSTLAPKLTVTKYLSTTPGANPTGSVTDRPTSGMNNPAAEVVFNVTQVDPAPGTSVADINPANSNTYVKTGDVFAGQTNIDGVIDTWYKADTNGNPTTAVMAFPTGIHYFIMEERQDISPSFQPGGRYYGKGYDRAQDSFFSLPYRTQDPSQPSGYLYHLHLYPKNVNNSDLTKQVTSVTDSSGVNNAVLARPGDIITYRLSQRLYNEGTAAANDNKLDVSELGAGPDLRVSDRMTTALQMDETSINVKVEGGSAPLDLKKSPDANADYSVTSSTTVPEDLTGTHTPLFPTDPGAGTKYWTFDFFSNLAGIQNYAASNSSVKQFNIVITFKAVVTANGDSTGASQGTIQNTVRSTNTDKGSGVNPEGRTDTPAATASFGKVDKAGNGLQGAVFHLVDPTDETKYLASNGQTYTKTATLPGGVTFYQAKSNNQGAVVFSALPILDSSGHGRAGDWRIEETTAPSGFSRPMVLFSKVSFAAKAGETDYVVGKTAKEIVEHFGTTPIEATHEYLSFGRYNFSGTPATPITVGGHAVGNYLTNYVNGEGPVNLPLTGGRGIVLLLVIGLIVMGGALYARNRRNASRA